MQIKMIAPRVGTGWWTLYIYIIWATFCKYTVHGKPLLYSNCLCRVIILIFNQKYWSVVRVVSGKIILQLSLRASLHASHTSDAQLKSNFLLMSTKYISFDRRKTLLESGLHTFSVSESQRSLLSVVLPKRRCSHTWSVSVPRRPRSSAKGDNWYFCLVAIS